VVIRTIYISFFGAEKEEDAAARPEATPLHSAAAAGQAETVQQLLLAARADLDAADSSGKSPLFAAAAAGHHAVVQLLLAAGADVDAADSSSKSLVYAAAAAGHHAVVQLLQAAEAKVNATAPRKCKSPLYAAAAAGHSAVVQLLLAAGAKVNAADSSGKSPLYAAAEAGHHLVVQLLLAAGHGSTQQRCATWLPCMQQRGAVTRKSYSGCWQQAQTSMQRELIGPPRSVQLLTGATMRS
jgi:ankyrin repeat protein